MANLRQIKTKIRSVSNLQKITRALEVVSTVKLQKLKSQADQLKNYILDVLNILGKIGNRIELFGEKKNDNVATKTLVIVVTSERGLCGGLNSKLLRTMFQETKRLQNVEYFVIGKKGLEFCKRANLPIVGSLNLSDTFQDEELLPLYAYFDDALASGDYTSVRLYFNFFKNSIVQVPLWMQLYPLTPDALTTVLDQLEVKKIDTDEHMAPHILIEPSLPVLTKEIRRQVRNYLIAAAVIENKAGEHAARMMAMKNAKDNATTFVKHLTLSFNKARQGAITQEISEIVSAKIAIEG